MNELDHRTAIKQILSQLTFLEEEEQGRNVIQLRMIKAIKEYINELDNESNDHFNHVLKAPLLRIIGLCNVLCLLSDNQMKSEDEFKDIVKKICDESETLLKVLENYFGYNAGISKKFKQPTKKII